MKNILKNIYLILLVSQLTACRLLKFKVNNQLNVIAHNVIYIKVKGIECGFCAESVIDELSKIEGVMQVRLVDYNNYSKYNYDFNNQKIEITCLPDKTLDQEEISKALNNQGFKLNLEN